MISVLIGVCQYCIICICMYYSFVIVFEQKSVGLGLERNTLVSVARGILSVIFRPHRRFPILYVYVFVCTIAVSLFLNKSMSH